MTKENESTEEIVSEPTESVEEKGSGDTVEVESTDSDTDGTGNGYGGDDGGSIDDSGNDDLINATAMIEQLKATIEGLNTANSQKLTENSIQIEELQGTITALRAELWTITRTLPNDSVVSDGEPGSDDPVTFDDLVAKATAKESE